MPPIQSELLRRAVGVVCEILIAELREILLHKKRKLIQSKLAKKQTRPDLQQRKGSQRSGPQPITIVSVDGMNVAASGSGHDEHRAEVIIPDDPLGSIHIKQEVEDEITFEDNFEDTQDHMLKAEVKEEMFVDDLMDCTVQDSSSNDLKEDSHSRFKTEFGVAVKQEAPDTNRGNTSTLEAGRKESEISSKQKPPECSTSAGKAAEKSYICKVCSKSFATIVEQNKHALIHKTGVTRHKCSKCKKSFTHVNKLKAHLLTHTEVKNVDVEVESILHSCQYCKRKYSDTKSLARHKTLHFQAQSNATEVIRNKYPGLQRRNLLESRRLWRQMAYKCKLCPKGFKCVSNLVKHVHFHHKPKHSSSSMKKASTRR